MAQSRETAVTEEEELQLELQLLRTSAPTVPVWPRSRFVRGGFGLSVAVRVALAQLPACRKLSKDVCLRLLTE